MPRRLARSLAAAALVLGLWALLSASGRFSPALLPSPKGVGEALAESWRSGVLLPALARSAVRGLGGYALGVGIGLPLGVALAQSRPLDALLGNLAVALQALPSACWFPLALLWFGPTEGAIRFVTITGAAPAVALAVRAGIRNLPPLIGQAARTLGVCGWRLGWHVLLPASLPACLIGMRQGWAFAWRTLMAAELLSQGLAPGLGGLLKQGQADKNIALMAATIGVILAISLLADRALFSPLERAVARRWGTS